MAVALDMTAAEQEALQSLWKARSARGRKIGRTGLIDCWDARVSGTDLILPMLQVSYPRHRVEQEKDIDEIMAWQTNIWAATEHGRLVGARIAMSIATMGFGWVFASELQGVFILPGYCHRLTIIGQDR